MKAIILCAGEGTRLRPLTHTGAKHLIPVANKPVVHYVIEYLVEAGIRELAVVVSPNVARAFRRALGDGSRWGVALDYVLQEEPKGLAHAVACARAFVDEEPFVMTLGDNLFEYGLAGAVARFRDESPNALISLYPVENPRAFGVARLEDERIVQLIEKPQEPPSNLAIVGVYVFDPHIFEAIEKIEPSWRGELEITDAIQRLIDDGYTVLPELVHGWWRDVGKPDDMLDANRLVLQRLTPRLEGEVDEASTVRGTVALAPGARVIASELRGPIIVGENTTIEGAFVGPFTAIDRDCVVRACELEYSIVMEGSTIDGVRRVDHSLIGRSVRVTRKERPPRAYRLVLGDNSHAELL